MHHVECCVRVRVCVCVCVFLCVCVRAYKCDAWGTTHAHVLSLETGLLSFPPLSLSLSLSAEERRPPSETPVMKWGARSEEQGPMMECDDSSMGPVPIRHRDLWLVTDWMTYALINTDTDQFILDLVLKIKRATSPPQQSIKQMWRNAPEGIE